MEIEQRGGSLRLVALLLFFFSPALAYLTVTFSGGNTILFEDGLLAQFPFRVFLHNAFVNGFSPQWMPSSAFGISLLAEGQSAICFPSTQIIYRMFSAEAGWIIEILVAHFAAFAFCYFLLKHLRVSRVSSLFGASVYTFCTIAFSLTGVPSMIWCYALLPGIFLWCDHFIEERPFSFVYLTTMFALLFLTGHPVIILYIGMIISVFFVVHMVNGWSSAKNILEIGPRCLALLGTVFLAALIASPQLLPIVHEFPFSARMVSAGISVDDLQNTMHLHPIWLPLSLFPTPPLWGGWEFISNTIRFPFFALFLGFIGMLFGKKGPRGNDFICLAVFSILMAFGPYVGLWKFVHSLPGLNHLRFPYRWLFFLPICVAFFSARGLDYFLNLPNGFPPAGFRRVLKSILLMGLASGVIFIFRYHNNLLQLTKDAMECSPWLSGLLWLSTIGMILAAFLSLAKKAARHALVLGSALSLLSLFATLAYNIQDPNLIRNLGLIGWKGGNPPSETQTYRTTSALPPYEVWMTNTIHRHYNYTPNLTILNGTLSTGYYFSFFPYWSANVSAWCQDALRGDHNKQIYLDLSSARWLFMPDGSSAEKVAFPAASFKGMRAYENPRAMPRASVVFSYRLFHDESDLVAFLESSEDFDPRRELVILGKDAEAWNLRSDANYPIITTIQPKVTIIAERPDRIEIELEPSPSKGAFLVLSDTYYPGWRALVDGVEKKVIRANYAFRGIQLPNGARHVVFFFDPLVPDAALPLPTFLLAALGVAMCFRHYLINKRKTGHLDSE